MFGLPFDLKPWLTGPDAAGVRLSTKVGLASSLSLCTLASWLAGWSDRPTATFARLAEWLGLSWNAQIAAISDWFNDGQRRTALVPVAGIAYVLASRLGAQRQYEQDYRLFVQDAGSDEPRFYFTDKVSDLRDLDVDA